MPKFSKLAAALLLSVGLTASALAADKPAVPAANKPFVTVNNVPVSQEYADLFINEQKAQGAQDSPELQNAIREELIRRELIVQQAKKDRFDKRPEVAAQITAASQAQLIRAYIQDYAEAHPISETQLRADYEKLKAQLGPNEYKIRHILVNTEDEAKAIIAKLKAGEAFAELAKQSNDPGTKDNGGDLGWAGPSVFVQPFGEAITRLEKGKFTETPVQTNFGYHVILVEDIRPLTPPAYEEIEPRLMQQAQGKQLNEMVQGLREKAKIK